MAKSRRKRSSKKRSAKKGRTSKAKCPHCKKTLFIGKMERMKGTSHGMGPF